MRFWDSSALVPLLVRQRASGRMRSLYRADGTVLAWWVCLDDRLAQAAEREGFVVVGT